MRISLSRTVRLGALAPTRSYHVPTTEPEETAPRAHGLDELTAGVIEQDDRPA